MRTKTYLIAFTIIMLLTSVYSFAQECPENKEAECKNVNCMHGKAEIPELTKDQQANIDALKLTHQREMIPLQADLEVEEINLNEMIKQGKDANAITKQAEKIGALQTKLYVKKIQHRIAVRNLLTDEQKAAFDTMKHKRPMMKQDKLQDEQSHRCRHMEKLR